MWHFLLCLGLVSLVSGQTLYFKPHGRAGDQPIVCPDKQGTCPSTSTCCLTLSGKYGCCPFEQATCCKDRIHCCPEGFKCNLELHLCIYAHDSVAMAVKERAVQPSRLTSWPDDGLGVCSADETRCTWGCCHLSQAVCCKYRSHCCPPGYQCDYNGRMCVKGDVKNRWIQLKDITTPDHGSSDTRNTSSTSSSSPIKQVAPSSLRKPLIKKKMICPGGKTSCDKGQTCCFNKEKRHFNCCPFINGICCSDGDHCCPLGFTCDIKLGKCTKGGELTLPWGQTHQSKKDEPEPEKQIHPSDSGHTICPDRKFSCPILTTCCKLTNQSYGCCPVKEAVCCSDHFHCCPKGYTCDLKAENCRKQSESISWLAKIPATPRTERQSTQCADNKTVCPTDTTCCPMLDGYYACCPFKHAKCCADKLHCCPSDEECDIEKSRCVKRENAGSVLTKLSAKEICPDQSSCGQQQTCCPISPSTYGCCPLHRAVCCPDHVHCCPEGYVCDATSLTCKSGLNTIPWLRKRTVHPVTAIDRNQPIRVNNVPCPGSIFSCPDQTTCCLLQSGQYGCCPLPNAVCCNDRLHCCPAGYRCDVKKGTCQKSIGVMPWRESIPAVSHGSNGQWVVCPDQRSQCSDGQTCCMLSSGQYGCCPLPQAVCCSDHLHCCPKGTKCQVSTGQCLSTSNSLAISWSSLNMKMMTQPNLVQHSERVTCPDKTTCPEGTTCCKMMSGSYGCCPYSKGTCCADQVHCCPEGFQCDKSGLRCDKHDSSITLTSTMFTRFKPKLPAKLSSELHVVKCPDGKEECPGNQTCCRQASGVYGCCPFPNAVCCTDGVHCCPEGYACDPQSGTCTQAIPWLAKVPATPVRDEAPDSVQSNSIICPDHQHQCPQGSTCCKLRSGEWGCCRLPQAVCCSDGEHCCPHGYHCDIEKGTCERRGNAPLSFLAVAGKAHDGQQP